MKALSVKAQFAYLLMAGMKTWETRSVGTNHRGLVAIHVSGTFDRADQAFASSFRMKYPETRTVLGGDNRHFALQHVIGVMELKEVVKIDNRLLKTLTERERDFGFWRVGHFAWRMKVVDVFEKPIYARGQLGLWNWDYQVK